MSVRRGSVQGYVHEVINEYVWVTTKSVAQLRTNDAGVLGHYIIEDDYEFGDPVMYRDVRNAVLCEHGNRVFRFYMLYNSRVALTPRRLHIA